MTRLAQRLRGRLRSGWLAPALILALSPTAALAQEVQEPPAVEVDDVLVQGLPLREQVETFVESVTAPPPGRGVARWENRGGVCVGVANLRNDMAQAMADRVSEIALSLGVPAGDPGCSPNVLVIATDDAAALAAALVERSPNAFKPYYAGSSRSHRDLDLFVNSDRPIRWWHVMLPVTDMGQIAVRMPGQSSAPFIHTLASRLTTVIRNELRRAYVIIDIDQVEHLTLRQLSDYVAMVAFAQIDSTAEVGGFSSILNVIDDPSAAAEMTEWDRAYLQAVYDVELNHRNPAHQVGGVAAGMFRDRQNAPDAAPAGEDQSPD